MENEDDWLDDRDDQGGISTLCKKEDLLYNWGDG